MMLHPLLRKLRQVFRKPSRRTGAARPSPFRPWLDPLEDRVLLATRLWSGAGVDSNWTTAANWVGGVAPSAGDDLAFPEGGARLTNTNNFAAGTTFNSISLTGERYILQGNGITLLAGVSARFHVTLPNFDGDHAVNLPITLGASQTFSALYTSTSFVMGAVNMNGFTLTVDGSGSIGINGVISGSGQLVKNGAGTLTLQGVNTYAGLTTVNAGTLRVTNSGTLGSTAAGTVVNNGATLQLNFNLASAEPLTLNGDGIGGNLPNSSSGALQINGATLTGPITLVSDATIGISTSTVLNVNTSLVTLNGHTLTVNSAGTANFNTPITDGTGSGSLVVNGSLTTGTVNLTAANTYTGTTTVSGGTLTLSGAGTETGSTSYTVNQGGTLRLSNTAANNTNRLPDNAVITLNGGTFDFVGNAAASSETVGQIQLARGHSTVNVTAGAGGATLTLADSTAGLTRNAGATVNFTGTGLGTATNRILIPSAPTLVGNNGGILPYATANTNDFATVGVNGIAAFTGYVTSFASAMAGDIVRLTGSQTVSASTPALTGLFVAPTATTTLTLNAGVTLTAGTLATSTAGFNTTVTGGTLNLAGTDVTPSEGIVFTNAPTIRSLTLTSPLPVSNALVVSGTGVLTLPNAKTYAGGTTLNSGTLNVVTNALGTGAVNLFGGTLQATATATFANALTFSNSNVTLGGGNDMTFSGTATLTGSNRLNVTSTSLNGAIITGRITGSGGLIKTGSGVLTLNPGTPNDYSGGTVMVQGQLTLLPPYNNSLGTGTLTLIGGNISDFNGSGMSSTTPYTIPNPVVINAAHPILYGTQLLNIGGGRPFVFTGPVSLTGNDLVGGWGVTFSGVISGTGVLSANGQGPITLSGNNTYTGATMITSNLVINGSQPQSAVALQSGSLAGTGTIGYLSVNATGLNGNNVKPGIPGGAKGVLTAPGADFNRGGDLTIRVSATGTAGVDYDQLDLGGGALTLDGTSSLTLDLAGLTAAGTANGIVLYGSRLGTNPIFSQVNVINNPNNFGVSLDYTANALNVTFISSPPAPPGLPANTRIWDGGGGDNNWTTAANWVGDVAPVAGDALLFPAEAARLVTVNNFAFNTTFYSITFSGSGYSVGGSQFVLTAGITTTQPVRINAVNNSIFVAIRLSASQTFSVASPGTTLTLSGGLDINGFTLTVDGAGDTSLGGTVSGTGGITKNGTGSLSLGSLSNTYTGLTTINAGTVNIFGNNSLGSTAGGTVVNSGGMLVAAAPLVTPEPLTLNGSGLGGNVFGSNSGAVAFFISGLLTLTGSITLGSDATIGANSVSITSSSPVLLNGHTLTVNTSNSVGINSPIVDGTGSGSLVVNQAHTNGIVTLTAANTYTGSTTVQGGTLRVSGNGTLASTTYSVEQGSILELNNSGTNNTNRLPDNAAITLNRGTFSFVGNNAVGAASAESVGTITLAAGHNTFNSQAGTGSGATATLTAASLTRNAGATVNFTGANLGTAGNRILFSSAPATVGSSSVDGTGILPYATVGNTDFATYAVNGVRAFTGYVTSIAAALPGDTVRLQNVNETVTADRTINALFITTSTSGQGTVTVNPGATLTLASGGVSLVSTNVTATPRILHGTGTGTATLNFGGSEGVVFRNTGLATSFLGPVITGTNGVTYTGAGGTLQVLPPSAGNSYTGGTYLNSGQLSIPGSTVNPFGGAAGGTLTHSGGNLVSTSGTLTIPNAYALNNANAFLSNVTLAGAVSLTAENILRIGGTVTTNGQITGTGGLIYDGGGNLVLAPPSGGNTYSGGTLLQRDDLTVANANGAFGSGPLTLRGGTLRTSVAGGVTLTNAVVFNNQGSTFGTTSGATSQPLTFSGPVSVTGNVSVTANVPVTFSGTASGTGNLTGTGPSSLDLTGSGPLTGAVAFTTGTSITVTGLVNANLPNTVVPVTAPLFGTAALGGTGTVGYLTVGTGATVNPGNPSGARGTLTAAGANFSNNGTLRIQIAGYTTPGTDYDRLNLGSGLLTLGNGTLPIIGPSRLVLDLAGLTSGGTANGIVLYGSRSGTVPLFGEVSIVNNPNNFGVTLQYTANSLNVVISGGGSSSPVQIIDDCDASGFSATGGFVSSGGQGFQNDVTIAAAGTGNETATWTFTGLTPGLYRVSATWTPDANRATNAPYTILNGTASLATVLINQELAPDDFTAGGTAWENLGGLYNITGTTLTVRLTDNANEFVIADAIRIERVGDLLTTPSFRILDNGETGFSVTAGWVLLDDTTFGTFQGLQGDVHYVEAGSGSEAATWTFTGLAAGTYRVSTTWFPHANRATNAPYSVYNGSVLPANLLGTVLINQEVLPNDFRDAGIDWEDLGTFTITGTTLTVRLTNAADEYVIADAVRIERVGFVGRILDNGEPGFSVTPGWTLLDDTTFGTFQGLQGDVHFAAAGTGSEVAAWTFTGLAAGTYRVSTTWFPHANRATNAPYTVLNGTAVLATVAINQEVLPNDFRDAGIDWEDLGIFTITSGTLVVRLTDAANEYVIADAIRIERLS